MDGDETATWIAQQLVATTVMGAGRMDVGERWELDQTGATFPL